MTDLVTPAPLWRRLTAAVYDGLLLLALWMVGALLDVIVRDQLLGLPRQRNALQVYFFLIGLGFFGWFWVHGGQTLGMRSWRLQLRRDDGRELRWPVAAVRYTLAWLSWLSIVGLLWCLIDARRRALHDVATATEVVVLPRT